MGRPKTETAKDRQYRIRLTSEEYKSIKECAKCNNMTIADLIRNGLVAVSALSEKKENENDVIPV